LSVIARITAILASCRIFGEGLPIFVNDFAVCRSHIRLQKFNRTGGVYDSAQQRNKTKKRYFSMRKREE
jgi:hypothetical protein